MTGRREVPVDPAAGPVQRFAFELRKLRAEADGITYRALARRAGYSVTTLSQAAAGERLPTLPVALAYAGACGGDLTEWEARWKEAVEEAAGDGSRNDDGPRVPYRGLARFEPGDSGLFFGREQLTADLVDLLRRRRFAAVFGPSGSGKSSLLRAGLLPVLRRTQEPGLRPAAIRILTPGEHPARSHAPLLTPTIPRDGSAAADTFVIVDQFEEVFTLCHDAAERARFIDLLLTARQPESRLRVLLAVRGDFYGRCAEHRDLADALRDANLLAGAMSRAELRDAVVKPATAAGLTVERALTTRLVEEVADAPGGLPLLSHALLETWRRRRGKTLTMAGYEAAGCLDGAIAKTAEGVYGRFTEVQAAATRRVLLRLVAPGDGAPDTRRPVERAELPGTGRDDTAQATAQVLEALAGARLLTLDGDTVEMAHEALITAWPRLRGWIEEDRERLRAHRNLTEAAHAWQELRREKGALLRGSRLATAQEHFGRAPREDLTDVEHAFLDASHGHERKDRRRSRLVLTAVTAALCLALVAAGLAVGQRQSAVTAQHLAQSRQLAAQSDTLLDSEPDLASLLAVHAYRTSPTREATAALYAAAALPLRKRLTSGTEPVHSLALSPDGHTLAAHGKVRIWDLPGGRLRHTFTGLDHSEVAAFSPDGRTLAVAGVGGDDAMISLWDPVTGRKLGTFTVPDGSVRGMAFSPDGRSVAASSSAAVRVWDVATGRTRHSFTGRLHPQAVAFGPDGRTVAAAGLNRQVRVWDMATGRTRTVHDSQGEGDAVVFSPDGRTYVVGRTDGVVQLREVATGIVRHTLRDGPVREGLISLNEVAFAPDGRTLAIPGPGDTVRLWDTASGTARATVTAGHHGRGIMTVALSADGRTLVTSSNSDPTVRVHHLSADHPRTTLPGRAGTYIADMAFSPDGRTVAAVRQGPPGHGSVQLWDARTGEREATLALDTGPAPRGEQLPFTVSRLGAVGFNPTGRALAARATENGVIEVRDVATGRLRQSRARGATETAVFSPDGTRLALVGGEGSVRIWHLSTGALHTVRTSRGRSVRMVAFTPDGRTLAVVTIEADGERVTLLDATTGRTQRTIEPGTRSPLSLSFSPGGHTLATVSGSNGLVKTWDARTGRLQDSFRIGGEVASLAFSTDGRTLAASSARGVHLWDLATSRPRVTLPARSHAAVAFSPDGRTLAIGAGSSVELWNVDLPDPVRALRTVCEAVDSALTSLEQSRYLYGRSTETGCPPTARQDLTERSTTSR
ncbi:helix-turn-helix domain-containing protein [Streptomyces sp. NPDC001812]|uniref:nSTAND1 domain-containing NTPase n=1 Tax=Streptomyces sp. NPDC001812 TaxID=3364611 RepID=UPI0036956DF6